MSRVLFAVVLLATLALTQGQIVNTKLYSNDECSGTPVQDSNSTIGECNVVFNNGAIVSTTASYVSADAVTSYTITYANDILTNCSTSTAKSMTATSTDLACKKAFGTFYRTITIIGDIVPSPMSFPPADWVLSTQFYNSTTEMPADTCVAGGVVYQKSQTASRVGVCEKRTTQAGRHETENIYRASYCSSDATQRGTVHFSDAACTNAVEAKISDIQACHNGATFTCGSAPTFPSLPNQGFVSFENEGCTGEKTVTLRANDYCLDAAKLFCGAAGNLTSAVTITTYTNTDGTCTTGADANVFSSDSSVCQSFGDQYVRFSCDYVPSGPDSSAAAASFSMISLIVAAFVALFARSL